MRRTTGAAGRVKHIAALSLLAFCIALQASHALAGEEAIRLKDAPGSKLTSARCVVCHSLDYIPMNAPVMNAAGWDKAVHKMIERFGAPISADEARSIVEYLSKHYSSVVPAKPR